MTHINVKDGDLYIIFDKNKHNVLQTYRLNNGAEFDFDGNTLVQLVLPNFESQLNRGSLSDISIELLDMKFDNTKLILSIQIMDDVINISLDCDSIIHKI